MRNRNLWGMKLQCLRLVAQQKQKITKAHSEYIGVSQYSKQRLFGAAPVGDQALDWKHVV